MSNLYKQKALVNQRMALTEEYEAVNKEISMALDSRTIKRLERRLENLEEQINSLDVELQKLKQGAKTQSDTETKSIGLQKFRNNLGAFFNTSDLKELCFNLEINYEDLEGESRKAKILDLVEYGVRHNRLADLKAEISRLRPHATW